MVLVAVLASLSPPAVFAALPPQVLQWVQIDKPGLRNNIVVSPSEVSKIAVSRGNIIYAIDRASNLLISNKVYRSDNAGLSWKEITGTLVAAGAVLNPGDPTDIAV